MLTYTSERLESSVWGPAIIQKLRSNDLTAQRPDTPARKAATLAASIDTRNVDAIRAAMFTTLHINKAKDALGKGGSSGGESALIASFGSPLGVGTDIVCGSMFRPSSHADDHLPRVGASCVAFARSQQFANDDETRI